MRRGRWDGTVGVATAFVGVAHNCASMLSCVCGSRRHLSDASVGLGMMETKPENWKASVTDLTASEFDTMLDWVRGCDLPLRHRHGYCVWL